MFKKGDMVKIKSKSTGRHISTVDKYNINEPQRISRIDDNRIIVIRGDYYLEHDLDYAYKLDDKLFEI
jgi:hypothetical protein